MDVFKTIILDMNNEIKKTNLNHSFIFFLFSYIFSLIIFKFNNFDISPLICLLLILTIGVSHGSLDHVKGKKLFNILNIKKISIFYFLYTLIAISVIIIWIIIPSISSNKSSIWFMLGRTSIGGSKRPVGRINCSTTTPSDC